MMSFKKGKMYIVCVHIIYNTISLNYSSIENKDVLIHCYSICQSKILLVFNPYNRL